MSSHSKTIQAIVEQTVQQMKEMKLLETIPYAKLTRADEDLAQFKHMQAQFYYAVAFFTKPMGTLMLRLPDHQSRLKILHNYLEEHGNFENNDFHTSSYLRFLGTLGITDLPDIAPCSQAFNFALLGACHEKPVHFASAMIGSIEYSFADISAMIGNLVIDHQWIEKEKLEHFSLHAAIDHEHAADLFATAESAWQEEQTQTEVIAGIRLGLHLFQNYFFALEKDAIAN